MTITQYIYIPRQKATEVYNQVFSDNKVLFVISHDILLRFGFYLNS